MGIKEYTESSKLTKRYGFPPWAPRHYKKKDWSSCDGIWGKTCFMAGSYPTSVGPPIPPDTLEARFEPFLSALAGMKGAFCRCYKSGSWVASASCNQDRDSRTSEADVFDHC